MAKKFKIFGVIIVFVFLELISMYYYGSDDIYINDDKVNYEQMVSADPGYEESEDYFKEEMEAVFQEEERTESEDIYLDEESATTTEILEPEPPTKMETEELEDRFSRRKKRMTEVCQKYNLDKPSPWIRQRTNQLLINEKYGLIWCNIFKAASSTWLWNFNILAGYTVEELMANIQAPLKMALKRYRRPSVTELKKATSVDPPPLAFIIVRHPFTRLISGFRDKILMGKDYYRPLAIKMMKAHPELQDQHPADWKSQLPRTDLTMPTFAQFVQYILDERSRYRPLNEHWIPMNEFCTPCLNGFDVIAKVETLEEDGNYIIYKAGIQDIIKPKIMNTAVGETTSSITEYYICQLNRQQMEGLVSIYKYDLELFDYEIQKYLDCTNSNHTL